MTSIDENENTPRETRQACEQSDHPEPPISPAFTKLEPPSQTHHAKSCNHKKHWLDYVTLGMELLGFVVLCVYAAYTIKIYRASKQSADAATSAAKTAAEQLEMTERPWIKIVDVKTHGNNPVIPALSFQNIRPFDGVSQQTTVLTLNRTSQFGATHTGIRSARTKNGTATPLQSLGQ